MFFLTGSAIPYIIYIAFIWGIFFLNTSINVIFDKSIEDENLTSIYEPAFTPDSFVYSADTGFDADNDSYKNSYTFYVPWIPEVKMITNSPPGTLKEIFEFKLLRSPPVFA